LFCGHTIARPTVIPAKAGTQARQFSGTRFVQQQTCLGGRLSGHDEGKGGPYRAAKQGSIFTP
jgi:hypothetical protein